MPTISHREKPFNLVSCIDELNRHVCQSHAVLTAIQLASENPDSVIDNEVLDNALWSVLDNLRSLKLITSELTESFLSTPSKKEISL